MLGVVAAILIVTLTKPANSELDIVPFDMDVAKEREAAWSFPRRTRDCCEKNLAVRGV
jgi:hypothetical protein